MSSAPSDDLPLYAEIRRDLEGRILSGEWPPGYRVPSEVELVERYGCSRMTVSKALSAMAAAGLIHRRRRSGSFVAPPRSEESVLEIPDIKAEILKSGKSYRYEIAARQVRRTEDADAGRIGLDPGSPVLELRVRHVAGTRPFVIEERLINLEQVPEAADHDFADAPPGTWLIERVPWTVAEHAIRAISADAALARALDLDKGAACLQVERRTWHAGVPVTWARLSYPGDRHRLVARFDRTAQAVVARRTGG